MATATFNTKIESSKVLGVNNEYDIPKVITYSGFDTEAVSFNLVSAPEGVTLENNVLLVGYGVTGELVVNVDDKVNSVNTSTIIPISFGSAISEFNNNENVVKNLDNTKTSWSSIINRSPIEKKVRDNIKVEIK